MPNNLYQKECKFNRQGHIWDGYFLHWLTKDGEKYGVIQYNNAGDTMTIHESDITFPNKETGKYPDE